MHMGRSFLWGRGSCGNGNSGLAGRVLSVGSSERGGCLIEGRFPPFNGAGADKGLKD